MSAILTGCATTGATVVPDRLLSCPPAPASPADDPNATEEDGALYVDDLAAAGQACRQNVSDVRRLLRPENTK